MGKIKLRKWIIKGIDKKGIVNVTVKECMKQLIKK